MLKGRSGFAAHGRSWAVHWLFFLGGLRWLAHVFMLAVNVSCFPIWEDVDQHCG